LYQFTFIEILPAQKKCSNFVFSKRTNFSRIVTNLVISRDKDKAVFANICEPIGISSIFAEEFLITFRLTIQENIVDFSLDGF